MDTDDLVQETLTQTLKRVEHFSPEHSGAFQGYLRNAILNRIRNEMRRVARRPGHVASLAGHPDPKASPLQEAIGQELLERYEAALTRLRAGDREAVLARVELGFSFAEVATALGKPSADAARMAVKRALLRLAEEMADADG